MGLLRPRTLAPGFDEGKNPCGRAGGSRARPLAPEAAFTHLLSFAAGPSAEASSIQMTGLGERTGRSLLAAALKTPAWQAFRHSPAHLCFAFPLMHCPSCCCPPCTAGRMMRCEARAARSRRPPPKPHTVRLIQVVFKSGVFSPTHAMTCRALLVSPKNPRPAATPRPPRKTARPASSATCVESAPWLTSRTR